MHTSESSAILHLMETAGRAVAGLALASWPHARIFWIACGTGNNAGDGFVAAKFLQDWGKEAIVTRLADGPILPVYAANALAMATQSGVTFQNIPPVEYDVCIDAMYGLGKCEDFSIQCHSWILQINKDAKPTLSIDLPTGLNCDTGQVESAAVMATKTLSLLTLKPGLFMAQGRDVCGEVWFNRLVNSGTEAATSELNARPQYVKRTHNSHKGSYGDVVIIGGAPGMSGAAQLAAEAGLFGGAGKVFLALLVEGAHHAPCLRPEIMVRQVSALPMETMTVVAGCGGATIIADHLPEIICRAKLLILDADALNAIAASQDLQTLLDKRPENTTILTPHPLEAARLAGVSTDEIQNNRILQAKSLAEKFRAIVVLKGSGTVVAAQNKTPRLNPTGSAKLAVGGSGDVLAGLIGAYAAFQPDLFNAACAAVFHHGEIADKWPEEKVLLPLDLCRSL